MIMLLLLNLILYEFVLLKDNIISSFLSLRMVHSVFIELTFDSGIKCPITILCTRIIYVCFTNNTELMFSFEKL